MKGKNMSSLVSNGALAQEAGFYSGATDEEVTEFILSTLREISIMAYSMPFTLEERERIARSIELLEGCILEPAAAA
jgi:hypothetical protein